MFTIRSNPASFKEAPNQEQRQMLQALMIDRFHLQFHREASSEFFNVFNRAQYGLPLADISSLSNFGQIIGTVNLGPVGTGTPRQIQFLIRVDF
jgi:hypothetical protein